MGSNGLHVRPPDGIILSDVQLVALDARSPICHKPRASFSGYQIDIKNHPLPQSSFGFTEHLIQCGILIETDGLHGGTGVVELRQRTTCLLYTSDAADE